MSHNKYREALELIYEGTMRGPGQLIFTSLGDVHRMVAEVLKTAPSARPDRTK